MHYTITEDQAGQRIDAFLSQQFPDISRSKIQAYISKAKVNQKPVKKNYKLLEGDIIEFELPETKESNLKAIEKPLKILYEDTDILVVEKDPFLAVHPDKQGNQPETLVNLLLGNKFPLSDLAGEDRPGIVHRLDKDTSGAILIAKTNKAYLFLREQFETRQVHKTYTALSLGRISPEQGKIEAPIGRDNRNRKKMAVNNNKTSKEAISEYKVLKYLKHSDFPQEFSLAQVKIPTGRTHQIRVHLQAIGHPIIGDQTYGQSKANQIAIKHGLSRQFLHATNLEFTNLKGEIIKIHSPLPKDLEDFLNKLEN